MPSPPPFAYASCKFGDHIISQQDPGDAWLLPTTFSPNRECPDAPNPEDGPMPGHEPVRIIVNPERAREGI